MIERMGRENAVVAVGLQHLPALRPIELLQVDGRDPGPRIRVVDIREVPAVSDKPVFPLQDK